MHSTDGDEKNKIPKQTNKQTNTTNTVYYIHYKLLLEQKQKNLKQNKTLREYEKKKEKSCKPLPTIIYHLLTFKRKRKSVLLIQT